MHQSIYGLISGGDKITLDYSDLKAVNNPSFKQSKRFRAAVTSVRHASYRFFVLAILVCIALLAFLVWPAGARSTSGGSDRLHFFWWSTIGLISLAVVLLAVQWLLDRLLSAYEYKNLRRDTDFAGLPLAGNSLERANGNLIEGLTNFRDDEITTATSLIRRPYVHTPRMLHKVNQSGAQYQHHIIKRVQFDDREIRRWVVLLHATPKNGLVADLQFKCGDKPISTLAVHEARALHLTVLTTWRDDMLPVSARHYLDADRIWQALMTAVCSDTPVIGSTKLLVIESDPENHVTQHPHLTFEDLVRAQGIVWQAAGVDEAAANELLFTIRRLAKHNLLWGRVTRPRSGHVRVEAMFRKHLNIRSQSFYERLRFGLGLIPRNFDMPLELALEAESYHLHFATPEGMYLYGADARLMAMETTSSSNIHAAEPFNLTLSTRSRTSNPTLKSSHLGSGFAHLYARGMAHLELRHKNGTAADRLVLPTVSFEFREKPPGNLMWAFFFSLYLGAIAWISGANLPAVFSGNIPNYWATVLLGLPTIVAGLLIARFTSGKIETVSLCTMAIITFTVVNALLLVGVSLMLAMHQWTWSWDGRVEWPALDLSPWVGQVASMPWAILMVSTLLNSLLIAIMMFTRSRRYVSQLEAM